MIPILGLMIAAYGAARLLQVPIEQSKINTKVPLLTVISAAGIIALGVLAMLLIAASATSTSGLPNLR